MLCFFVSFVFFTCLFAFFPSLPFYFFSFLVAFHQSFIFWYFLTPFASLVSFSFVSFLDFCFGFYLLLTALLSVLRFSFHFFFLYIVVCPLSKMFLLVYYSLSLLFSIFFKLLIVPGFLYILMRAFFVSFNSLYIFFYYTCTSLFTCFLCCCFVHLYFSMHFYHAISTLLEAVYVHTILYFAFNLLYFILFPI